MFAVLFLERDPLRLADVPLGLYHWVQTVGGFAMIGVVVWLLADWVRRRPAARNAVPAPLRGFVSACLGLAAAAYLAVLPLRLYETFEFCFGSSFFPSPNGGAVEVVWRPAVQTFESVCLFIGGFLCIAVVLTPFVLNLLALRWRRIFALAGLSFKEALRRRVLWAFSALLLVFLFGSWFISGRAKHEDQLRTYVQLVFWAMTPLLLFTSVLLAAFSIPADIRQQTIHTVLTKPVQRFEVYLGRVLGFGALMSLVLLVLSGVSLLYVLRGVDPDSAAESLKARSPLFGMLSFENTGDASKGVNVGEEWGYRSYVTAPTGGEPPQTAVFHFADLPSSLVARLEAAGLEAARAQRLAERQAEVAYDAQRQPNTPPSEATQQKEQQIAEESRQLDAGAEAQAEKQRATDALQKAAKAAPQDQAKAQREAADALRGLANRLADLDTIRCEFNFAIYRAYKGEKEARGIGCAFTFQTWRFDPDKLDEYRKKRKDERNQPNHPSDLAIDDKLAETYGYYEIDSLPVTNFHTMTRDLPGGLFKNAEQSDPQRREYLDLRGFKPAPLEVRVRCLDKQEYVGMARYDMYLRQDDPGAKTEAVAFAVNFLKGATGLWMRLVLIIAVAVALSTYLSNVITLLVALMLYVGGIFREFIYSVVAGKNVGGGPLQAFFAVAGRQVGVGPQERSPTLVYEGVGWSLFQHDTSNLEQTTSRFIFGAFDPIFRWVMGRVFDLIPDVDRFDLTLFVAEGFDISLGQLLTTLIVLIGYLLPWAVLAYYLLKWREIASNT